MRLKQTKINKPTKVEKEEVLEVLEEKVYESYTSVMDYYDKIEDLFTKTPDKRTNEYKVWKHEINFYIQECNNKLKMKVYPLVS